MQKQNRSKHAVFSTAFIGTALLFSGCASIVHSGSRTISVDTNPSGATAEITREPQHETVASKTTPFTVALDPRGGFFKGQTYKIKFDLKGYQTGEIEIRPVLSGWYFGNILLGGLIGMIIVDPATGSMWNLSPENVHQSLTAGQTALVHSKSGFVVTLLSQTTEEERAAMVRIN